MTFNKFLVKKITPVIYKTLFNSKFFARHPQRFLQMFHFIHRFKPCQQISPPQLVQLVLLLLLNSMFVCFHFYSQTNLFIFLDEGVNHFLQLHEIFTKQYYTWNLRLEIYRLSILTDVFFWYCSISFLVSWFFFFYNHFKHIGLFCYFYFWYVSSFCLYVLFKRNQFFLSRHIFYGYFVQLRNSFLLRHKPLNNNHHILLNTSPAIRVDGTSPFRTSSVSVPTIKRLLTSTSMLKRIHRWFCHTAPPTHITSLPQPSGHYL